MTAAPSPSPERYAPCAPCGGCGSIYVGLVPVGPCKACKQVGFVPAKPVRLVCDGGERVGA